MGTPVTAGTTAPPAARPPAAGPPAAAPPGALREFYENPEIPASSGPDRARRMARLLAVALRGTAAPACILDLGCGDGAAAEVAVRHNPGHRVVGLDWSASALAEARRLGLTVIRAGVDPPGLPFAAESASAPGTPHPARSRCPRGAR